MNIEISKFLKSLNDLAPLKVPGENFKIPYKPAIILAIFKTCINENYPIFNNEIDFSEYNQSNIGTKIIKKFYDIIVSIPEVYELLRNHCSKTMMKAIYIGFNIKTFKKIRYQIFDLPLDRLAKKSNFLVIDKDKKTIKFNCNFNDINENELTDLIILSAYNSLKSSNKYYESLELDSILNYEEYKFNQRQLIEFDEKITSTISRQYQHIFSKIIKDRDTKCVICCEDFPGLLDAAHIKSYSVCDNLEKYDEYNGITLCKTHHSLFDEGYFTFNDDLTILLSTDDIFKSYKEDLDLKFKQYESCLDSIKTRKPTLQILSSMNKYLKYHKDNIFKK